MKKCKLFVLLIALTTFLISGCSMDQNLKLESSNLSAVEFYAKACFNQSNDVVSVGDLSVSEEEKMAFLSVVMGTTNNEYDFLNIVCAMDFSIGLSNDSESSEKSKIYEFEEENSNIIVKVNKKTSSSYTVGMYLTNKSVTEIDTIEPYAESEVKLTDVSKNINYILTYKINNNSYDAEFTYDNEKGYMKIAINVTSSGTTNYVTREIYNYVDNVVAVRTKSKFNVQGVSESNYIYEIMQSPYLIRAKIGEISDTTLLKNLNKTTKEEIASGNTSDKWCYVLTAKGVEEGAELKWQTSFNKYGNIE